MGVSRILKLLQMVQSRVKRLIWGPDLLHMDTSYENFRASG